MDVKNLLTNYINQNSPKDLFQEKTIFHGEIIRIEGDIIFLEILGKGIIQAESNLDLEEMIGEDVKFIVESKDGNTVKIKPLINESLKDITKGENRSISKILKDFNIKETDISKDLTRNLMKYEVPLKSNTLKNAIKTLDKLIELSELKDEGLFFIDNEIKTQTENNKSAELDGNSTLESKENHKQNNGKKSSIESISRESLNEVLDELPDIKKEFLSDIKKLLVSNNLNDNEIKLGKEVKEILENVEIEADKKELLDIISLMTKNKIKPSLNNIKNLKEFIDNPLKFAKVFEAIEDIKNSKQMESIKNKDGITLNKEFKDLNVNKNIKNIDFKNMEDKDIGIEKLKTNDKNSNKLELINLKEKIEFIKDLNKDMYFHLIPFNVGKEKLNGIVNIIKEKDKNKTSLEDNINIYISLDTNNLGNITVSCQSKFDRLEIKVGIDKKDIDFFEKRKEVLIKRIEMLGFNISTLEFIWEEKVSINDNLRSNSNSIHFLDIKV